MKNRVKIREKREEQKQKKKEKYSTVARNAQDAKNVKIEPVKTDVQPAEKPAKRKSLAKAAGLKSTLINGGKIYTTSFGKGNSAVIEQSINTADYSVTDISAPVNIKITRAEPKEITFVSKRPSVTENELSVYNPFYPGEDKPAKKAGNDMLGLKDELEKRYFGKTFDDNIHIQIIYNILDIEKIIAEYSTNISAAINHLIDGDNEEFINNDFIGYMSTRNTYDVFMDPSKNPKLYDDAIKNINTSRQKFEALLETKRLRYFGFDYDSKDKLRNKDEIKRIYHLIAFAGQLRQWSAHSKKSDFAREWLYQLEHSNLKQEYRDTLDYYFDSRFAEINENFVIQNAVNLTILRREVFPEEDFQAIAELYYDFIVVKSYKNIGFSIKKLREKMLECEEAGIIRNDDYNGIRSKLYKLIDFCIFHYYHSKPELVEEIVNILRASTSDEQKEEFYTAEGERIWQLRGKLFLNFCSNVEAWSKEAEEDKKDILKYIDKETFSKRRNVSYFAKLLYAMCIFLDGKEINDLLTTLINKFDNIASFIRTAETLGVDVTFDGKYDFFNSSSIYVDELNIVKNIARMRKPTEKAKPMMMRDALTILGIPAKMTDEELDAEINSVLEKKQKSKNPFRNFISNNVIKNSRFIYVIKFCNPENVRKLVNNTYVTKFVLKRMPEEQIGRYYYSCIADADKYASVDSKIAVLAKRMQEMDFGEFRHVEQKSRDVRKNKEKERFKAVIGLYLTVVYQLIKNLVKVNARYVMAFHALERDSLLYGIPSPDDTKDYLALTEKLCNEGDSSRNAYLAKNKHMRKCVAEDIDNAKKWFIGVNSKGKAYNNISDYRNKVAHLSAVRNCADYIGGISKIDSYFALYHYIIQRQLAGKGRLDPTYPNFERNFPQYYPLFKYHTYVKDMVKALNVPFGYNIPRFKALTIGDLFDKNEKKEKAAKKLDK